MVAAALSALQNSPADFMQASRQALNHFCAVDAPAATRFSGDESPVSHSPIVSSGACAAKSYAGWRFPKLASEDSDWLRLSG